MINAELYVAAKEVQKVTTTVVNGLFQATFAETDELGNPVAPVIQTASAAAIANAITSVNNNIANLQAQIVNEQTLLADLQALQTDATKAGVTGGLP